MAYTPINAVTRKKYSGKNIDTLTLAACSLHGLNDPRWMTFLQAQELGYKVKKGAKGTQIFFGGVVEDTRPDAKAVILSQFLAPAPGEAKPIRRVVKRFTVFHASQIEGIPPYKA